MTDFNTGPRAVPDVAGRDVGRPQGRPGTAHAHRSADGYHRAPVSLGTLWTHLWARYSRLRDRHGA